jgi:hypothetical protein
MGEWLRRKNQDIIRAHCSTRFYIDQETNSKKLLRDLKKSEKDDTEIELPDRLQSYILGGNIYFSANTNIEMIRNQRL